MLALCLLSVEVFYFVLHVFCFDFRGILEFLDLMKLDMANFQLQRLKPILVQQSVEYERSKLKQFLELYPGMMFCNVFGYNKL